MIEQDRAKGRLLAKAVVRMAVGFAGLAALLVLPAGTWTYWQAWAYLGVLFVLAALMLGHLYRNDPGLLERRMRSKEPSAGQARIVWLGSAFLIVTFLVPGLDRRYGWSDVPVAAVLAADLVALIGYAFIMRVFRENSWASRVVAVEPGQRVVTTGPYALVRHPMYLGALVMYFATPIALGSWWGMLTVPPLIAVLAARIRDEERLLERELDGYREYMRMTRYRLVPRVW